MNARLPILIVLSLAAVALVPTASAFGPLVGACVKDVTHPGGCSGDHTVCVYGFSWVPVCEDALTLSADASLSCGNVNDCKQQVIWIVKCVGDSLGGHSCH